MTAKTPANYISVTLKCPRCWAKQVVRVEVHLGSTQAETPMVTCVRCDKPFAANVPSQILDGPFPADVGGGQRPKRRR